MKKKVIFGAVAALFLGAGIFTSVNLTEKHQMSDLTLANIEAVTQGGLPAKEIAENCNWLDGGCCTFDYNGWTWDNSNMTRN